MLREARNASWNRPETDRRIAGMLPYFYIEIKSSASRYHSSMGCRTRRGDLARVYQRDSGLSSLTSSKAARTFSMTFASFAPTT